MSIKPSAAAEVRTLVAALAGPDEIKREAAIARLAVIGPRAVDRLLAAYTESATTDVTRVAILRVFEGIADPRLLPVLRSALTASRDLALPAIGALRGILTAASDDASAAALDALVALVVDPHADRSLRLAAFDALRDAPADVREQLSAALRSDADPAVRARVEAPADETASAAVEWEEALAGRLGPDPGALLSAARHRGSTAPLGELQKMIETARRCERETAASGRSAEWRALRGELHQALALRGSTVALYDLRESLSEPGALPGTFVAALHAIGDAACLEPMAAAYERSHDDRWRGQLAAAMDAIAAREKMTPRHAIMKRLATRWPDAYAAISMPSRTTPRQTTRRRT